MPQEIRRTHEQLHALINATKTLRDSLHATRIMIGPQVEMAHHAYKLVTIEEDLEHAVEVLQEAYDYTTTP